MQRVVVKRAKKGWLQPNIAGNTPVHFILENDDEILLKSLIQRNRQIIFTPKLDRSENNALHIAARYGAKKSIQLLLKENKNEKTTIDIHQKNILGDTPLHELCRSDKINNRDREVLIEKLIKNGAKFNRKNKAQVLAFDLIQDDALKENIKKKYISSMPSPTKITATESPSKKRKQERDKVVGTAGGRSVPDKAALGGASEPLSKKPKQDDKKQNLKATASAAVVGNVNRWNPGIFEKGVKPTAPAALSRPDSKPPQFGFTK